MMKKLINASNISTISDIIHIPYLCDSRNSREFLRTNIYIELQYVRLLHIRARECKKERKKNPRSLLTQFSSATYSFLRTGSRSSNSRDFPVLRAPHSEAMTFTGLKIAIVVVLIVPGTHIRNNARDEAGT